MTTIGKADARVRILAGDLALHLMQRGWVDDASVRFLPPDSVVVVGRPRIAGVSLPPAASAEFRGRLLAQGPQLRLGIEAFRIGPLRAPTAALAVLEQLVNPVFDASVYAVPSRVDSVEVEGDALSIKASGARTLSGVREEAPGHSPPDATPHPA